MIIKNKLELVKYQKIADLSTKILKQLKDAIKIGITPLEVDQLAFKLIKENKARAAFYKVKGTTKEYQHATCISVNDTVVHGIPDNSPFESGDVIKLDFGIIKDNLYTDHCFTVGLGDVSEKDKKLINITKEAVQQAAKKAVVGNTTGDLGYTMQSVAEKSGFSIAKEFVGHGIGKTMHDFPQVPDYGVEKSGVKLEKGMVLCVEAQVIAGSNNIYIEKDGWTAKTVDHSKSAMFEYMVVVGEKKPVFLTKTLDWPILV
jgi:methionyl aminopeptidase